MSYCIVQTIEDEEVCLCSVPSGWVINKELFWPNTKNINKLLNDPHSKPGPQWSGQPCTVKRKNIKTIMIARSIENEMAEYADTEAEDWQKQLKDERRRHPVKSVTAPEDLNELVEVILNSEDDPVVAKDKLPGEKSHRSGVPDDTDDLVQGEKSPNPSEVPDDDDVPREKCSNSPAVADEKFNQLFNKMNGIEKLLHRCLNEINGLHIKVDHLEEVFQNHNGNQNGAINAGEVLDMEFPLGTIDDVEKLEMKLSEAKFRNAVIAHMCLLGGTSGEANGTKVAYKCIDAFFTRSVLINFSWTGSSKQPKQQENQSVKEKHEKISFLKFNRIINTFLEVINKADNRFSRCNCEDFFKKVLKNAHQRLKQKKVVHQTKADTQTINLEDEVEKAVAVLNGEH